jgi:Zn-dependent oligopeptidase
MDKETLKFFMQLLAIAAGLFALAILIYGIVVR